MYFRIEELEKNPVATYMSRFYSESYFFRRYWYRVSHEKLLRLIGCYFVVYVQNEKTKIALTRRILAFFITYRQKTMRSY